MGETATDTPISPAEPAPASVSQNTRKPPVWDLASKALQALASLRLTVILFALSVFLVFAGTLAQVELGIWTVVTQYFRGYVAWIPFQLFLPPTYQVSGSFPFPGGWLLGSLLLTNLLAAHAIRFKLSWKRSGIILLHAGLIIMMVSELVTGRYALEGQMRIDEGGSSNVVYYPRHTELAIIDASDPQADDVVTVPGDLLRKGKPIRSDLLPFELEPVQYMVNSAVEDAGPGAANRATAGFGLRNIAVEKPEISGTSQSKESDVPSLYATLKDRKGQSLGTYLFSMWLKPQPVTVDRKTYQVGLRIRQDTRPFSIHLIDFRFDRYLGTETAKNFSSLVRLEDPERNDRREVVIRMNEPLRYQGETFYQADYDKDNERTTFLQVVRNPGWLMPYISCVIVALGMLIHFGIKLTGFLRMRAAA